MRNLIRCWGWRFWLNRPDRIFAKTRQCNEHESPKIEPHWEEGSEEPEKVWSRRESLINNKNLPYSTGNYIRCPMINQNGKEYEKEYMCCVQSLSCVWLFVAPWTAACQTPLSSTISWSLLKCMYIELVMLSNHLILCHPLLLLLSIFSSISVFSNELALCIMWPKYWSFSFSISPSNEYSGLSSLGLTHLLAVEGALKGLL